MHQGLLLTLVAWLLSFRWHFARGQEAVGGAKVEEDVLQAANLLASSDVSFCVH